MQNELDKILKHVSSADKIQKDREDREKEAKKLAEDLRNLAEIGNKFFSTKEGQMYLKAIMQLSGTLSTKSVLGAEALAFNEGKRYFYINGFKKILDPKIMAKLEKEILDERGS